VGEWPYDMMQYMISPFKKTNWVPADYFQLKDERLKSEITENGYAVLKNFFDAGQIEQLWQLYNSNNHVGKNGIGMFITIYSADVEYRKRISAGIRSIISASLNKIFTDYKTPIYNYIVKGHDSSTRLPLHQDMALVDEHLYSMLSIWAPLQPVHGNNGALQVLPRSHYLIPPFRNSDSEEAIVSLSEFMYDYMRPIDLLAGDLLVFDSRIIHYSGPNVSGKDRVAFGATIVPAGAPYIFLRKNADAEILSCDVLELSEESFFKHVDFESADSANFTGKVLGKAPVEPIKVDAGQFYNFCRNAGLKPKAPAGIFAKLFQKLKK
jgi:ectoine hydroxylase-related dioxygenase (phytanoyl-CoA dioxygenase family)